MGAQGVYCSHLTTLCGDCDSGYYGYSVSENDTTCTKCPEGKTTDSGGATNVNDCEGGTTVVVDTSTTSQDSAGNMTTTTAAVLTTTTAGASSGQRVLMS